MKGLLPAYLIVAGVVTVALLYMLVVRKFINGKRTKN
jgi:hypothetical protein